MIFFPNSRGARRGIPPLHALALALALLVATPSTAQPTTSAASSPQAAAAAPRPVSSPYVVFGFQMGDDGQLASWEEIQAYFSEVADRSDRVELITYGRSTGGRAMLAAVVSAPENISRLEAIRTTNLRLADPRTLPEDEAARLARRPEGHRRDRREHPCHRSRRDADGQRVALPARDNDRPALARDPARHRHPDHSLDEPGWPRDGHRLVRQDEGHHVRGRADAVAVPQVRGPRHQPRCLHAASSPRTVRLARFFYRTWHPQVFLTMHQMGQRGPRFFVPPNYDPIDPELRPAHLAHRRAARARHGAVAASARTRPGVISNAMYDYYWPGYEDSAPIGHNTVCLLTEVGKRQPGQPGQHRTRRPAGVAARVARVPTADQLPQSVDRRHAGACATSSTTSSPPSTACSVASRGTGRRSSRTSSPWVAGPWTSVAPERRSRSSCRQTSSIRRRPQALEQLLIDGAVEIHRSLEPFRAGDRDYPADTDIVLMAQPFRAYAKTLLETQQYPVRRLSPNAPPERPYDVAGWTLPLQMNVDVHTVREPFELPVITRLERATLPRRAGLGRAQAVVLPRRREGECGGAGCQSPARRGHHAVVDACSPGCPGVSIRRGRARRAALEHVAPAARAVRARARVARHGPERTRARQRGAGGRGAHWLAQAVGREHRRGLDAAAARALRVPVRERHGSTDSRRRPPRAVRRHRHP